MNLWQRLAHRLFGWHYVAVCWELNDGRWKYQCHRVLYTASGRKYVLFGGYVWFFEDGTHEPLTWTEREPAKLVLIHSSGPEAA